MLLLLIGGLGEYLGDLHESFFPRLAGEVCILIAGLGFAAERGEDVLLGLGTFEAFHRSSPVDWRWWFGG